MRLSPEQHAAWERLRRIKAGFPLWTFRPAGVFGELKHDSAKRILVRAANQIGKTMACSWLAAYKMVTIPGYRVRIIGPSHKHAQKVVGSYLNDFCGPYLHSKSWYQKGRGWNGGQNNTVLLANGSVCTLLSTRDQPESHSGAVADLVLFDEPPPAAHYSENAARIATIADGRIIIAATMVNRDCSHIRDMVQGGEPDPAFGRTEHRSGWVQYVAPFSAEQCPWFTPAMVEDRFNECRASPWDYAQRIEAAWEGVSQKRVYSAVTDQHVSEEMPTGHVKIGLGIDHGMVGGHQAVILMAYRAGKMWVMDEHLSKVATTPEEECKEILQLLQRNGLDPSDVDSAVGDISTSGGWRINEAMSDALKLLCGGVAPFEIQRTNKAKGTVDWGNRVINYAAMRDDLRIHPRCKELLRSIRLWQGERMNAPGLLSHSADALRYAVLKAVGDVEHYAKLRFS